MLNCSRFACAGQRPGNADDDRSRFGGAVLTGRQDDGAENDKPQGQRHESQHVRQCRGVSAADGAAYDCDTGRAAP